jgi:sulfur-carrier protein
VTEGRDRATVVLPASLVALLPALPRRLEVDPGTVAQVIDALERQAPGARDRLCEPGPRLRRHINVFVDGQLAGIETPVAAGSVVHVIPAVSGGAQDGRLG